MGLFFAEKTPEQKRMKALTRDIKELRRQMLFSKLEKKEVEGHLKQLQEALVFGGKLRQGYVDSQEHMALARRGIMNLLETMHESSIEQVKRDIVRLNGHLENLYHECGIRTDDLDFSYTADALKNMAEYVDKSTLLMLRSELENLQALLDDTAEWRSPNFFALAYYLLHEPESKVGEMENEYRNAFLERYVQENLMELLELETVYAGCFGKLQEMLHTYIYD